MELYPRNKSQSLDRALFRKPTSEYRGAPFWAWNNKLNLEQLLRQIGYFQEMGFGGFHMHARTGLDTHYLGPEFLEAVVMCVEEARARGMLAWLYDEDRWPSGFGGGFATRDSRFRAKHLLFTPMPYNGTSCEPPNVSAALAVRMENGTLLARYEVALENGCLARYRRLLDGEEAQPAAGATLWYAYIETAGAIPVFNNQTYVDTLSKEATERFIEVTHERYAAKVGGSFGSTIPAIFTDEPQFVHKQCLERSHDLRDLCIPWTDDLLDTYRQAYDSQSLEEHLPELFWELPGGASSQVRYRYHDHVCERFARAFADTLGDWCRRHGIALTGHVMEEFTLEGQTVAVGEAMRHYRSFGIPGIDMLCDAHEYTTAKQAQSVARQYGRPGVMSELYGVTNWDFSFAGHKAQGDWQAALGVTVRVPHLAWVSMQGEAKRDYPASIQYQSPWFREYPLVEDHFSRLNVVLTRGRPRVRVGVVHPIESYWLLFGPLDATAAARREMERSFADLTRWLLFGLVDFDFVSEALLPSLSPLQEGPSLQVGEMRYDAVVVPPLRTIRLTTLERLESLVRAGGTVIFAGDPPALVDALPSERALELARRCGTLPFARDELLGVLAPYRGLEVQLAGGEQADPILHQVRDDGDNRYVFLCNTDRLQPREGAQVMLRGDWRVTRLDTLTGRQTLLASRREGDNTVVPWDFSAHGSLLLMLESGWRAGGARAMSRRWTDLSRLEAPVSVSLHEPNVLPLDQAAWRLDDEAWQEREEALRIGDLLRGRFGLPLELGEIAQPWTQLEEPPTLGWLSLKYDVQCDVGVAQPSLALEDAAQTEIYVDGSRVPSDVRGWWVDESIQMVRLPALSAGRHEIVLVMPYTRRTSVEWCYLLGDFGVRVAGREARIVAPVRTLQWGDWTQQGLPFYAGNVTYRCAVEGSGRKLVLHVPHFRAPLLAVDLDGRPVGKVAFAPFRVELGTLENGTHRLDITAYGNRINAFGPLHNADKDYCWFGPPAWRTFGRAWTYEYQLKPMGLLAAPALQVPARR